MENERPIKVFIVVTMYNEDADELRRTLKGVLRNIDTFVETEGEDAWKQICVCIVSDGRDQADKGIFIIVYDVWPYYLWSCILCAHWHHFYS